MRYRLLEDLTSDVMFEAYGKTFEKLLENAASATFSVICDIKKVKPKEPIKIEISSDSEETLLYKWLAELLTQSEINNMFLTKFEVKLVVGTRCTVPLHLSGIAWGEPMSPEKSGTVVKGVTYYGFKLGKTDKGYKARVALDI